MCFACARVLRRAPDLLCPDCRRRMDPLPPSDAVLDRAREVLAAAGVSLVCVRYRFRKEGPVQDLLHQLKYGGMSVVGRVLGRELGETVGASLSTQRLDGVVPVPLHRGRLRERGYNQSALIAAGVAEVLEVPLLEAAVYRARGTISQTELTAAERLTNVRGAFAVSPDQAPAGCSSLLLVDDVLTTGATLASCASALQACRPALLIVCAVAAATLELAES